MAKFSRDDDTDEYRPVKSDSNAVLAVVLLVVGGLILLLVAGGVVALWVFRTEVREEQFPRAEAPIPVEEGAATPASREVRTPSGLVYETVAEGNGPAARSGQTVRIHETLTLPDGRLIFSSRTRGQPVTFRLGGNQVIAGVDEGVTGMRMGERRKLVVPPSLDSRTHAPELIPPGSILHYDIELVEIVQ